MPIEFFISALVTLLVVVDPIGLVPAYLAVTHGLPVIGTTGGAIPDTVPSDASLLIPPGDMPALAKALRRVIGDSDLRQRLTDGARAAAPQFPTWRQSAEIFARKLEMLA